MIRGIESLEDFLAISVMPGIISYIHVGYEHMLLDHEHRRICLWTEASTHVRGPFVRVREVFSNINIWS